MLRLASHPIAQVEHRYQMRALGRRKGVRFWIGRVIYAVMLATALIFYLGELIGALLWRDTSPIIDHFPFALLAMLIYLVILQITLVLTAVVRGANSIARERQGGTWEILTLTHVTTRQIVWSKWWAIVRSMVRPVLMIVPLKAALAVLMGTQFSQVNLYMSSSIATQVIPPKPLGILLVLPLMFALTFAAVGLGAAVGVMLSSLVRRAAVALASSLVIYTIIGIAGIVMIILLQIFASRSYYNRADANYNRYLTINDTLSVTGLTWFENGIVLSSRLVSYEYRYVEEEASLYNASPNYVSDSYRRSVAAFFLALIFSLGIYPPLIWLVLRVGQAFARRQGALPPG
jgi:ABC-type transport system involved in multi-copper enzyme maturation permease subunit